MSWSYSQALVEEFSAQCFSDTGLSALLNTTHTPDQYYWPDKTTEHSRLSRFGMMPEPLTAIRGEALLMWFLAGFHAKTSALQEAGPDWTAKGQGYGEKWHGLLARFDRDSCSLKTVQYSLLEDSTECCPTLPRWGLMLDGELYQQPIPALHTNENESGYWPTPCAQEASVGGSAKEAIKALNRVKRQSGAHRTLHLRDLVKLWPTPTVCGNYNRPGASATSGIGLASAVKLWPTPCASASKGSSQSSLIRKDGKDRSKDRLDHAVMDSDGGQLNPEWVEWLMGWPIGHTELKPLATAKFLEFELQHGIYFMEIKEAA